MLKSPNPYLVAFACGLFHVGLAITLIHLALFNAAFTQMALACSLMAALTGAGIGSLLGHKICRDAPVSLNSVSKIIAAALVVDVVFFIAITMSANAGFEIQYLIYLAILLGMTVRCASFPIIIHIAAKTNRTGREIATGLSAIATGALVAALLYGLCLIEVLNSFRVLFILTAVGSIAIFVITNTNRLKAGVIGALQMAGFSLGFVAGIPNEDITRLVAKQPDPQYKTPQALVQNHYGVLHSFKNRQHEQDTIVYVNNRYDSQTNVRLFQNINQIDRAYLLASLFDNKQSALLLGLNLNAWASVLLQSDKFTQITIIEKNPAYAKLLSSDPVAAQMLSDKRIRLITADPVMWLKRNPAQKFDLVAFNPNDSEQIQTTPAFLKLVKASLSKTGVTMFHSNYSNQVIDDARAVFGKAHLHNNMLFASAQDLHLNLASMKRNLCLMSDKTQQPLFKTKLDCKVAFEAVKLAIPRSLLEQQ